MRALLIVCLVGLLVVPAYSQPTGIPDWIKQSIQFWAEGQVSDTEFISAMTFLINEGIIDLSERAETVTIGFIPVEKADELTPKAEELMAFLEKETGMNIEIEVTTNYETIIEGMRFGHIDAAFMDTGPAWITHQRTGAEVALAEVVQGKVNYQATVWALAEEDTIKSLKDTLGKRVAFTSITGSSGFVRPMGSLVTSGHITVQGDDIVALERALDDSFKAHTFAGGYKAALELLLNGNVDVAFGSDIAPQKYLSFEDQAKIKSVAVVGAVPSHVFMVNGDMSDNTRQALVDALVKLNHEDNNKILTDLYGAEALLPTTTKMHIGDFGTFIDALTGLDQKILDNAK